MQTNQNFQAERRKIANLSDKIEGEKLATKCKRSIARVRARLVAIRARARLAIVR